MLAGTRTGAEGRSSEPADETELYKDGAMANRFYDVELRWEELCLQQINVSKVEMEVQEQGA